MPLWLLRPRSTPSRGRERFARRGLETFLWRERERERETETERERERERETETETETEAEKGHVDRLIAGRRNMAVLSLHDVYTNQCIDHDPFAASRRSDPRSWQE